MKNILLFLLFIFFTSCNIKEEKNIETERTERITNYKKAIDSINKSLNWKEIKPKLWKSKNGDFGIKTRAGTDVGVFIDKYISQFPDGQSLKKVIDLETFTYLGSSFYKDKNHIYTHYEMADGGNFWIVEEADVNTFEILGNCYAKDKNFIFGERAMKMDSVDYKTFKTCEDCACYAKDKNGFYFWDSKIDLKDIDDEETLKIIETLKLL